MKTFNIIVYWFLQLTWGSLMTILGFFVILFCKIFLKAKIHKNGCTIIAELKGNWGGLELGAFALCGGYTTTNPDEAWFQHTRRHEFGHSIQNIIFGPLNIFITWIPSIIRYHYRNWRTSKGLPNPDYDSIWFEGTATKWGTKIIDKIEKE